jgi:hypothetical protein
MRAFLRHDPVGASPIRVALFRVAVKSGVNRRHDGICRRVRHWASPFDKTIRMIEPPMAQLLIQPVQSYTGWLGQARLMSACPPIAVQ